MEQAQVDVSFLMDETNLYPFTQRAGTTAAMVFNQFSEISSNIPTSVPEGLIPKITVRMQQAWYNPACFSITKGIDWK